MKMTNNDLQETFWKSMEDLIQRGKSIADVRVELRQAGGVRSFMAHHHSASAFLASKTESHDSSNEAVSSEDQLKRLKARVKLCVMVWATEASPAIFTKAYAKAVKKSTQKKLKKRLKNLTDEQIVLHDLIRLLQHAAFLLSPNVPFATFLRECIPRDCYSARFQYVWNHFEVENPYEELPPVPAMKPRRKHKRKLLPTPAIQPKSNTTPKPTNSLLPDRVPLTTRIRKDNTLTSRNRFVGSHFNAGLSNMNVLFRQVTMVKTPARTVPTKVKTIRTLTKQPPTLDLSRDIVAGAFRSLKRRRV